MARRTFRRKGTGGRWFPVQDCFKGSLAFTVPGNGDTLLDATGLVADGLDDQPHAQDILGNQGTLLDVVQGTGYFVKRVVGQYHAHVLPITDNGELEAACYVKWMFGIAVLDVDQDGIPNNLEKFEYAGAGDWGAGMQRWVFQRFWYLNGNGPQAWDGDITTSALRWGDRIPSGTWAYGDVRSGPHVDVKTRALVRPDQRMFQLHQGVFVGGGELAADRVVVVHHNLRMFATMRRNLRMA